MQKKQTGGQGSNPLAVVAFGAKPSSHNGFKKRGHRGGKVHTRAEKAPHRAPPAVSGAFVQHIKDKKDLTPTGREVRQISQQARWPEEQVHVWLAHASKVCTAELDHALKVAKILRMIPKQEERGKPPAQLQRLFGLGLSQGLTDNNSWDMLLTDITRRLDTWNARLPE